MEYGAKQTGRRSNCSDSTSSLSFASGLAVYSTGSIFSSK